MQKVTELKQRVTRLEELVEARTAEFMQVQARLESACLERERAERASNV